MKKLKDTITLTMLQGVSNFLTNGILLGEFDSNTTVSELMSKVEKMKEDKMSSYNKRMRNVVESGQEDEIFS